MPPLAAVLGVMPRVGDRPEAEMGTRPLRTFAAAAAAAAAATASGGGGNGD